MIFYVSLFLVSLAIASVAVWAYRVINQATHKRYRAILPSAKSKRSAGATAARRGARGSGLKTPWGWNKPAQATAAGRQPMGATARSAHSAVGWPYRKEPFEVSANRRIGEAKPGTKVVGVRKIGKGGIDKPWGW